MIAYDVFGIRALDHPNGRVVMSCRHTDRHVVDQLPHDIAVPQCVGRDDLRIAPGGLSRHGEGPTGNLPS